jgi:hypothetical protein
MKNLMFVLFTAILVNINTAMSQKPAVVISNKPGWYKIGEVTVALKTETESIIVFGHGRRNHGHGS